MLHCHPSQAWALMKRGWSLAKVAERYGIPARDLDLEIWRWRTSRGVTVPAGMATARALGLHHLGQHDSLARDQLRERA